MGTANQKLEHIEYRVREMQATDNQAYMELLSHSPDVGYMGIQIVFKENPYEMLMQRRPGEKVYMVETPDGKLVGSAAADPRPVWFKGQPVHAVHLHSLMVDPDFRHLGVATALVQYRIKAARESFGRNVLIFAEIQQGNQAAVKNAEHWINGYGPIHESGFIPTFRRTPKPLRGVTVREARPSDYPAIVEGFGEFNQQMDFTRYVTVDRLRRNLEPIHGSIFRHRYVVEQNRRIVGGAVLSKHDPSTETRVIYGPFFIRLRVRLAGIIDENNLINAGEMDGIWFRPGYVEAAHYLIEYLRSVAFERDQMPGINLTVANYHSWEAVQIAHWMPHAVYQVVYQMADVHQPPVPYVSHDAEPVPAVPA